MPTELQNLLSNAPEWNPEGKYEGSGSSGEAAHDGRAAVTVRPKGEPKLRDVLKDAPEWRPDADYGEHSPAYVHPDATWASIARQVPVGFNEGIADVAGAPVDLVAGGINKMVAGGGWQPPAPQQPGPPTQQWTPPGQTLSSLVTGQAAPPPPDPNAKPFIQNPIGGSDFIKSGMGLIGADPRAAPAQTPGERIARGIGGGVAGMVGPEALVGVLERAGALTPKAIATLEKYLGRSGTPAEAAKQAVVGATTGGAGEAAAERVPEEYKPLARMGAAALTAPTTIGAMVLPGAVKETAREFLRPMNEEGRDVLAGRVIAGSASSPAAVRDALENQPPQRVSGSEPTLAQASEGDVGLHGLERQAQTAFPGEFEGRRAAQNKARIDAIKNIQPEGSPVEVANGVRAVLADIDAMTESAAGRATQEAQGQRERLGGTGTSEQYGAGLRAPAQAGEDAARKDERGIWDAIDPDRTMTAAVNPVKDVSDSVYRNLSEAAKTGLTPAERNLTGVIQNYKFIEPFRELTDLRSAVSAEMRKELRTSGRTPAYARLSALRGGLEEALTASVQQKVAQDARGVARGEINVDQTSAANLRREVDARQLAGDNAGAGTGSGSGTAAVSGSGGTARQAGRGPANAPVYQGVPTFDRAAQDRLAAATAATRERVATYGKPSGPVGQILQSAGERGQYKVPTSGVGEKIFTAGPGGFENVQAYRRAVANDPEALNTLQDYVASRLQSAASRADGTLDPTKTANWLKAHSEAMRAFPELAAKFQDAAAATSTMEDIAAVRKHALDSMQKGKLAPFIGAKDDADVTKIIGKFLQSNDASALAKLSAEATSPAGARGRTQIRCRLDV